MRNNDKSKDALLCHSKKRIYPILKKIGVFFDRLLFPENLKCIFCGTDVPNFDEKPFCDSCEKVLSLNNKNKCLICAEPIDNEAVVCDFCQKHKRNFKMAFCPFVYEGIVRNAVLGYKDSNQRYKAKTFAKFIVGEIEKANVKIDYITYIPLTRKKQKSRTFNQAKLLSEEIGKLMKVEVMDMFEKLKENKGQKYLSYKERQNSMIGMYETKDIKLKKTQSVLIVDDVITTCATVNYCAGLINKKVKNVYVCAIARNKLKSQKNWQSNSLFSIKSKLFP